MANIKFYYDLCISKYWIRKKHISYHWILINAILKKRCVGVLIPSFVLIFFLVHSIYEPCEDTEYIKKMGEDCLKTYYRNLTAAIDHHSFCRFVQAKLFLKEATVKIIVAYFYFLKTIYESFKLFRKHIVSKHINRMFM